MPPPLPLDMLEPPDEDAAAAAAAKADTGRMEWEEVMVPSGRRNDISAERRTVRPMTVEQQARDDDAADADDADERRRFIFVMLSYGCSMRLWIDRD